MARSSSHTMGPNNAAIRFRDTHPAASRYEVTLYGSLAATGKGHLTDRAILDVLEPVAPTGIVWKPEVFLPFHPNGMKFEAYDADGRITASETVYSVGGGDIVRDGESRVPSAQVYDMTTIKEILQWCETSAVPTGSMWINARIPMCGTICVRCGM